MNDDNPISSVTAALREVAEDEFKALVAVETAERLAVMAHRALAAGDITRAQWLLSALTDVTTTRTATAVKSQQVSDAISVKASAAVSAVLRGFPSEPEDSDDENAAEHAARTRARFTGPDYEPHGLIRRPDRPGGI